MIHHRSKNFTCDPADSSSKNDKIPSPSAFNSSQILFNQTNSNINQSLFPFDQFYPSIDKNYPIEIKLPDDDNDNDLVLAVAIASAQMKQQ